MKIALCFYGQPRHIENPYTFLTHKYFILDRYETDVFVHTWISGEEKEFEYSDWVKKQNGKEPKNAQDLIITKYKPKKYKFEKPIHFSLDEKTRKILKQKEEEYIKIWNGSFNYSINNENNTLSQLYSMSESINLVDDNYDWIILSRYDNYIIDIPNLYQLEKDNLYLHNKYPYNFTDLMIIGSQPQIKSLACYDQIEELCEKINYFTPEEFKRLAFQLKYEKEKRVNISIAIARSNTLKDLQL